MPRRSRQKHAPAFQAKVAFAAVKGERTLAEFGESFEVHLNQIQDWQKQLLRHAEYLVDASLVAADHDQVQQQLYAKLGQ